MAFVSRKYDNIPSLYITINFTGNFISASVKVVELAPETKQVTITAQVPEQKHIVPVFIQPLVPETRANEKSVARYKQNIITLIF